MILVNDLDDVSPTYFLASQGTVIIPLHLENIDGHVSGIIHIGYGDHLHKRAGRIKFRQLIANADSSAVENVDIACRIGINPLGKDQNRRQIESARETT